MKSDLSSNVLPKVSVVVVCYNYGRYLLDAVASVQAQTYENLELLVVDGGSDDALTLEVIEKLEAEHVTVLRRDSRKLAGDNRNYGIERANGEFICCLDADDVIRSSYIEKAVILLLCGQLDMVSPSKSFLGVDREPSLLEKNPSLAQLLDVNQFNTVTVFRKSLWVKAGGYDDFGLGSQHIHEDWHFWLKCLYHGARVQNLNFETLFRYRVHSQGSLSSQEGSVPDLEKQRAFIRSCYEQLRETEDADVLSELNSSLGRTLNFSEEVPLSSKRRILIAVECFDTSTVLDLLVPWIESLSNENREIVLLACGGFEDREDRLGLKLDRLTPHHFDFHRSFEAVGLDPLLKHLCVTKGIEEVWNLDHALESKYLEHLSQFGCKTVDFQSEHLLCSFESVPESEHNRYHFHLETTGTVAPPSSGSEVWLLSIRNAEGFIIKSDIFDQHVPDGWRVVESAASPIGRALLTEGIAHLDLDLAEGTSLRFLCHDWSGSIKYQYGMSNNSDCLYAAQSATKDVVLNSMTK